MNKSKRQLYEENEKYKEMFKVYRDFWEYDMSKSLLKQLNTVRNFILILSVILLCAACFLIGLSM